MKLLWVAVHRGLAEFRGTSELSEREIVARELDEETRARFTAVLQDAGVDPEAYVWMLVHPWQWDHAVQVLHAADVAQKRIIPLGESPDAYLPGQSIRTMANVGTPERYDVKLPLNILNTLVWRGIPPHCTMGASVVTQWLGGLVERDAFLTEECRTVFLGEVASVTVSGCEPSPPCCTSTTPVTRSCTSSCAHPGWTRRTGCGSSSTRCLCRSCTCSTATASPSTRTGRTP